MEIWGKSKAIHGTWFFLPEFKLLLDAGEGASSSLGIHGSDIETVFISHTHLDHIAGLVTIGRFQKRTLKNEPNRRLCRVLYHRDCEKKIHLLKKFLEDFYVRLDFIEIEDGEDFLIKKNTFLRVFKVDHNASYYRQKITSVGCHIVEKRTRLKSKVLKEQKRIKAQYKDPKAAQKKITEWILKLKKEQGEAGICEEYDHIRLSYCGDSRPVNPSLLKGTEVLMHEATFIDPVDMEAAHSCVGEVVSLAKKVKCKALVIYHLSERYKRELPNYKEVIFQIAKKKKLDCPLFIVGIDEFFRKKIKIN